MTVWRGKFYDGVSARCREVIVQRSVAGVRIAGEDFERDYSLAEVSVSEALGTVPRALILADGSRCELTAGEDPGAWLAAGGWSGSLHTLERQAPFVGLALLLTLGLVAYGFISGIPWLAERTALQLPPSITRQVGEHGLAILDGTVFTPSAVPITRQDDLRAQFQALLRLLPTDRDYHLIFRQAPKIGANAFALPSGTIVLTDELVNLAVDDQELLAILAHETGHLQHRHALRALLQDSVAGLLLAAVTGDVSSVAGLGAAAIIDRKYSREFESEADDYAREFMGRAGIPRHFFVDILSRLDSVQIQDSKLIGFLATHPLTAERIRRFEQE